MVRIKCDHFLTRQISVFSELCGSAGNSDYHSRQLRIGFDNEEIAPGALRIFICHCLPDIQDLIDNVIMIGQMIELIPGS